MIKINLDENSVEDFKAIQELQKMGFSDEQIQKWYDNSKGVIPSDQSKNAVIS